MHQPIRLVLMAMAKCTDGHDGQVATSAGGDRGKANSYICEKVREANRVFRARSARNDIDECRRIRVSITIEDREVSLPSYPSFRASKPHPVVSELLRMRIPSPLSVTSRVHQFSRVYRVYRDVDIAGLRRYRSYERSY